MTEVEIHLGGNSENVNYNNYLGTTYRKENLILGDVYWWSYWEMGLRFQLPFWRHTTINSAYLYMYLLSEWSPPVDFISYVKIENVAGSRPLRWGIKYRNYWSTTVPWHMNFTTFSQWYDLDITTLISHIVLREGWKKDNHICLFLDKGDANNEDFHWNSYRDNYLYASYLLIDYTLDSISGEDTFNNSDSDETSFTNPSSDKMYLDDIEIHPEIYEHDKNYDFGFKTKIKKRRLPANIVLSDVVDYTTASQLHNLIGKNVPLWIEGDSYNVIVQNCTLNFIRNYVYIDISLLNTRG